MAEPPSKASLKAWWAIFSKNKHTGPTTPYRPPGIPINSGTVFGKPLVQSLEYASVQISTANPNGDLFVWGYIPVVVAKCGLFLKEHATDIEGVFRVNGSAKRMRDLQQAFEAPPKYGKQIDWKKETYTPHDVASVFRRYLTQMPEPVIPHDLYFQFRDTLRQHHSNPDQVINTYKQLIRSMPRPNQYLLLYVLDLLSVFAKKSDKNLMTAQNLAVIFRPGIISHPTHEMSPQEHGLSQQVLEFLIAHQDWFMFDVGIPPTPGVDGMPIASSSTSALPSSTARKSGSGESDEGWSVINNKPSAQESAPQSHHHNFSRWKSIGRRRSTSPSSKAPLRTSTNTNQQESNTKVQRRKTLAISLAGSSMEERGEGGLSPVSEDVVLSVEGGKGVSRSRTLPSRSGSKKVREPDVAGRIASVDEEERTGENAGAERSDTPSDKPTKKGLLRKVKRTSNVPAAPGPSIGTS